MNSVWKNLYFVFGEQCSYNQRTYNVLIKKRKPEFNENEVKTLKIEPTIKWITSEQIAKAS